MRFSTAVAACALLLVGAGCEETTATGTSRSAAEASPEQPLLAIGRAGLVTIDRRTLRPLPGRAIPLGGHGQAWSFSPDGSLAASASESPAEVRFLDLVQARVLGGDDMRLARRGTVLATLWPTRRLVLALVQSPGCCVGEATIFAVDPFGRRVVRTQRLGGSVQAVAAAAGQLLALVGPASGIGPTKLVVVDRRGLVRSVALPRTRSGQTLPTGNGLEERHPGLAVDRGARRAFVVGAGEPVAEIDLRLLQVEYHTLSRPVSVLQRLGEWLVPAARADVPAKGPNRYAVWLGNGLLAVSGWDATSVGGRLTEMPAGLDLVDTRRWTVRTVDERVSTFSVVQDMLLAYVPAAVYGAKPLGLVGYEVDGTRRFQLFGDSEAAPVLVTGDHVYVMVGRFAWPLAHVVDVRSGRVVGTRSLPQLGLVDPARSAPGMPWSRATG